ncbi:kinesin motor domain containing protein [Stylonychia lemnae]|uniref:Kinesin motor domain containing protein n=1 Tax=Stylonychia lemnae TaxID=5949 RepID=A0A078AP54_STYLE|nr:kinesin motor domain containing protein [Stylonychia lemnae]|eukprot:CDW83904.1 kinesin motor domain containing protein [Stylonychia lemnae]
MQSSQQQPISKSRLKTAVHKPGTQNQTEKDIEKSRNQNKSLVASENNLITHSLQINEKSSKVNININNQKSQNLNKFNSSSAKQGLASLNKNNSTANNSPVKEQLKSNADIGQSSMIKLNNMTAVQLNQHQIQIEQQISSINDQQNAEQQVKSEKIRVAVRVRPFLAKEIGKESVCYVSKNGKQIRVSDLSHTIEGTYDKVFPKEATQNDAYSYVADVIPNLLQGFNCTIFAYGQTGSGKTYTMFGEGYDSQLMLNKSTFDNSKTINESFMNRHHSINQVQSDSQLLSDTNKSQKRGLIPRCISELFNYIKTNGIKVTIYCSFLQIYNEKLYDLLQDTYTKNPLQIREEKLQGIYVEGLSEYVVQDDNDCLNLLKRGEKNRIKRSTKMNIKSSRSHSLFQLLLETDQVDNKGMLKRAKLNLGDLAGSEKVNKDEEMKAKHMLELRNINLSLTTLGKVIQVLSQGGTGNQQNPHVPFRESKLTRLLQDSLGGNCQTYLIATVSPLLESIEETISTLKFADRAKCVMQRVKKNEINAKDDALVQKLQKEVHHLKELLQLKRKGVNPTDLSVQLYMLKDENERLRQYAVNYEDVEKMKQENKQMRLELQRLRMMASDVGSNYNGDISPKSFQGAYKFINKNGTMDFANASQHINNTEQKLQSDQLTDSDESIQEQFKNYKSELNFDIKLENNQLQKGVSHHIDIQTDRVLANQKVLSSNQHNQSVSPLSLASQETYKIMQDHSQKQKDQVNLKHQKERLQNVIQESQNHRSLDLQSSSQQKPKQHIALRKRYKEGDLSDEGSYIRDQINITLPAINENSVNMQQQPVFSKIELS